MQRNFKTLMLAVLALLLLCCSCQKIKNIRVTSYQIESIVPNGLRSAYVSVGVGVDNPAMQFSLNQTQVTVHRQGVTVGTIHVDPVTVNAHSTATYHVNGRIDLAPNVKLTQVLSYISRFDPAEYTLDIDTKVKLKSGVGKMVHIKDVPVDKLLEKK